MKRKKKVLYRTLNRLFGNPHEMSEDRMRQVMVLLRGWMQQQKPTVEYGEPLHGFPKRWRRPGVVKTEIFTKHAGLSASLYKQPEWHWKVRQKVKLPVGSKVAGKRLGVPPYPDTISSYASELHPWEQLIHEGGKTVTMVIPATYHATVARHDIRQDGRRLVQRVWNHRTYTDKETWQCSFWDFSKVGRSEWSWTKATWHEGYVVKTSINMAVDTSLSKALNLATRRTVMAGINTILDDHEDTQ